MASTLATYGIPAIGAPMIAIVVDGEARSALARAINRIGSFQWVVFTSANGVRSFDSVFQEHADEVSLSDELMVAVVGPTTRAAVQESSLGRALRFPVNETLRRGALIGTDDDSRLFMSPVATAADLVASFPATSRERIPGRLPVASTVLAVLGQLADGTVTSGLESKGYTVDRVDAYGNVAPDRRADVPPGSIVTFFSPSAVDRFGDCYGVEWQTVCIGPRTASQAAARGFDVISTAEPHNESGVISVLRTLFRL